MLLFMPNVSGEPSCWLRALSAHIHLAVIPERRNDRSSKGKNTAGAWTILKCGIACVVSGVRHHHGLSKVWIVIALADNFVKLER